MRAVAFPLILSVAALGVTLSGCSDGEDHVLSNGVEIDSDELDNQANALEAKANAMVAAAEEATKPAAGNAAEPISNSAATDR